jgi:hypothetical protein
MGPRGVRVLPAEMAAAPEMDTGASEAATGHAGHLGIDSSFAQNKTLPRIALITMIYTDPKSSIGPF